MSTRSAIGYIDHDGHFVAIYCHFDGYPGYVGMKLAEHYRDMEKVLVLVHGSQIRNLDHDGTAVRYGNGDGDDSEVFDHAADSLRHGFDYCYVYSGINGTWKCFSKISHPPYTVWECEIPE